MPPLSDSEDSSLEGDDTEPIEDRVIPTSAHHDLAIFAPASIDDATCTPRTQSDPHMMAELYEAEECSANASEPMLLCKTTATPAELSVAPENQFERFPELVNPPTLVEALVREQSPEEADPSSPVKPEVEPEDAVRPASVEHVAREGNAEVGTHFHPVEPIKSVAHQKAGIAAKAEVTISRTAADPGFLSNANRGCDMERTPVVESAKLQSLGRNCCASREFCATRTWLLPSRRHV